MGEARHLAAGMAEAALPARITRTWKLIALSALAVLAAMRLRNMLLPVVPGAAAAHVALSIDGFAHRAALVVDAVTWLLARTRGTRLPLASVWICAASLALSGAARLYLLLVMTASRGWLPALPVLAAAVEVPVLSLAFGELCRRARQARCAGGGAAALR
jgi:hypothetical protein